MTYAWRISFVLIILLVTGCATTTTIQDPKRAEVVVTSAGEILYHDKTIPQEQIPELLRAARVTREECINIRVPANQEARDYTLMRSIADTLRRGGYGRFAFVTEKKAMGIVKPEKPGRY